MKEPVIFASAFGNVNLLVTPVYLQMRYKCIIFDFNRLINSIKWVVIRLASLYLCQKSKFFISLSRLTVIIIRYFDFSDNIPFTRMPNILIICSLLIVWMFSLLNSLNGDRISSTSRGKIVVFLNLSCLIAT